MGINNKIKSKTNRFWNIYIIYIHTHITNKAKQYTLQGLLQDSKIPFDIYLKYSNCTKNQTKRQK